MTASTAVSLVHDGWNHLRLQRPLAAWAAWQRALRLNDDDPAARQALAMLETAPELPVVARAVHRFQTPSDEARRRRWDVRLRGRGQHLDDLEDAIGAFRALTGDDPSDLAAHYNLALCQAWAGHNSDAIWSLEVYTRFGAETEPDRAAAAWTLAELLRLGAGAEDQADDLRHVWTVAWPDDVTERDHVLSRWPYLRAVPMPDDPLTGGKALEGARVFEWLDRPVVAAHDPTRPLQPEQVARVLATVIDTPRTLRLSTPDYTGLFPLGSPAMASLRWLLEPGLPEATPLPIAWADAALGTFRFPPGLDAAALGDLTRGVVERYFETIWIRRPRKGLGGQRPIDAARQAVDDPVMRAKLEGVVRFREQLGMRPTHALLYRGYPFDRLRRRLGLIRPESTGVVDPDDVSCLSEPELDALDPTTLDGERLADAFTSAAAFDEDARTARFAGALAERQPLSLGRLDLEAVFAPLVRQALEDGDPELALRRLDLARELARDARQRRTFLTWSAEVQARQGRPGSALGIYQSIVADCPATESAAAALDGAETLLDNGASEEAIPLLRAARSLAGDAGDTATAAKAAELLATIGQ